MKKSLILFSLLLITTTACNDSSNTNKKPTTPEEIIAFNIEQMRHGFKMNGSINQERQQVAVTSEGYVNIGNPEYNYYNTNFVFNDISDKAFHRYSYQEYQGENVVLENITYFGDENGDKYIEYLNYDNTIQKQYSLSSSFDVNSYYNFFTLINPEDITYEKNLNEERYHLEINKAAIISSNLLSYLNSGFYDVPERAYFKVDENGYFSSFVLIMNDRFMEDSTDGVTYNLYVVENTASFTISEVGTAKVERLAPVAEKAENNSLKEALSKINDNFTLKITDDSLSMDNQVISSEYKKLFFTGNEIYVKNWTSTSGSEDDLNENDFLLKEIDETKKLFSFIYDSETQQFVQSAPINFPNSYQGLYFYKDLLPIVNQVSEDLFTYNALTNCYEADLIAINTLTTCFGINLAPFRSVNLQNSSSISIRISDDNSIDYIDFAYNYISTSSVEKGKIRIEYSNVGKTELPL